MSCVTQPESKQQFIDYYAFRWKMLRQPWGQELGSERDEFEGQSIHRMVVDPNNEVVAVGRLHFVDTTTAQVRYVAVAEQSQGKGYGRMIMDSLEHAAASLGFHKVVLNARDEALVFYECLNYKYLEKTHLLYGKVQHHLMEKHLKSSSHEQTKLVSELQKTWHETIPLSQAMSIEIAHYNGESLVTHCNPEFNRNLHHTMFAGSIYTLATLTGWGWVYLQLATLKLQGDIVLAQANIEYKKPIVGLAHAVVKIEHVSGDLMRMQQGKHGKLAIRIEVKTGDMICAIFHGKYVAIANNAESGN